MLKKGTVSASGVQELLYERNPGTCVNPDDAEQPVLVVDEPLIAAFSKQTIAALGTFVAKATDLTLLDDASMTDGALVWVQSRKRYFSLDKLSSNALVDGEIVATNSGTGRFVSVDASTSFTWSKVATWNLNGTTGNDDNDGTVLPLKTGEELARRIGQDLGRSINTTINILDGTGVNLSFIGIFGTAIVIGQNKTTVFSGTLTAQTAIVRSPGPGNSQLLQAAGLGGSWTALGGIDKRIRLTSGATLGTAWAMIDDGGGNNQVETTPFFNSAGNPFTPAGNENFVVENLQTVASITVDGIDSFSSLFLQLIDLDMSGATTNFRGGFILGMGCKYATVTPKGDLFFESIGCYHGFIGTQDPANQTSFIGCGHVGPLVLGEGGNSVKGDAFLRDVTISLVSTAPTALCAGLGPIFAKNTSVSKQIVNASANGSATQGSDFVSLGVIYGSTAGAATDGVVLGIGSKVALNGLTHTFTSTGNNWTFGSTGKTHAQLPFVDQFNIGAGPVANANMAMVI